MKPLHLPSVVCAATRGAAAAGSLATPEKSRGRLPSKPQKARRAHQAIVADYRAAYPSAMATIERDLDALLAQLG